MCTNIRLKYTYTYLYTLHLHLYLDTIVQFGKIVMISSRLWFTMVTIKITIPACIYICAGIYISLLISYVLAS